VQLTAALSPKRTWLFNTLDGLCTFAALAN
jgi:hypothetical protein